MIYTFQPIDSDESNYFAFWAFSFIFTIIALVIDCYTYEYEEVSYNPRDRPFFYIFVIFALGCLIYVYNKCSIPPVQPKNVPVIAHLVSTSGETVVNRSGKSGYSYSPELVVQYEVPEGVVTLKGSYGVIYPKEAILYAN